jgi:hypothetical protein
MKQFKNALIILISFFAIALNAQTQAEVETAMKRKLQGDINEMFNRWDDKWSYDTYQDETAIITSINEGNYSDRYFEVSGIFKVSRGYSFFSSTVSVAFSAKVSASDNNLRVTKLCYSDPGSARAKDCISN